MVAAASGNPNISRINLCDCTNLAADARGFSLVFVFCLCCSGLSSIDGVVRFEKTETKENQSESRIRDRRFCAETIRADNEGFIPGSEDRHPVCQVYCCPYNSQVL